MNLRILKATLSSDWAEILRRNDQSATQMRDEWFKRGISQIEFNSVRLTNYLIAAPRLLSFRHTPYHGEPQMGGLVQSFQTSWPIGNIPPAELEANYYANLDRLPVTAN